MQPTLLRHQYDFIQSESKKALLLGGIGVGKSHAGAHFVINMVSKYPKSKGIITANVYNQLVNATVSSLTRELDLYKIPNNPVLSGSNKRIEVLGSTIYLYSLEKADNIRGIEVGWWWGDESCFSKKEAIDVVRGRLRDRNGPLYERHTSSPNGFNWAYDEFETFDKNKNKSKHLIRAKTKDNIFLPEGYYSSLLEDYGGADNPLARQELFGEFTNLQAGAIYWAFDRRVHVQPCKLDVAYPVYACQDFNVNNMAGCYFQKIGSTYFVCKENILNHHGANTDSAGQQIATDLRDFKKYVIPDSTGKSVKSSSSGRSDIEILKSYGLEILPTTNPFIRDRQNTVNIRFKQSRVVIDPSCKELIKELETLSSRDKEGDKAHVSVALGYGLTKLEPLHHTGQRIFSSER
jgi:phage terminase large subunit